MRPQLVLLLLLAVVALSSSNVLPISKNDLTRGQLGYEGQHNDNTFSNRYQTRNVLDEIYKIYAEIGNRPGLISRLQLKYADPDNNQNNDILSILNKDEKYNGEGFWKEQWHNYPRQLDRLHQFYEQNTDKRKRKKMDFEPDPNKYQYTEEFVPDNRNIDENSDGITNQFQPDNEAGMNNLYDVDIAATNPLLTLKLRLACLNKDIDNANAQFANLITFGLDGNNLREDEKSDQIRKFNPEMNVSKVKREGVASTQINELADNPTTQKKGVNKRIFSLWSRLQSLNHKGHELQHRRHLHAFYGLPDSDGGGILTAETRATFMRPPGSPLRWG